MNLGGILSVGKIKISLQIFQDGAIGAAQLSACACASEGKMLFRMKCAVCMYGAF